MAHTLTIAQAEAQVREAVAQFPTPNMRRALSLAESGRLSWFQVYGVVHAAVAKGAQEVSA